MSQLNSELEEIINKIIRVEGGYVDHEHDRGGATNYGITERVARNNGYTGHMKDLPLELARDIYRNQYIIKPGYDKVAELSVPVAVELSDTGVNMGTSRASVFLQRALNVLNRNEKDYRDIAADGKIGPNTLATLYQYLQIRGTEDGEIVLLSVLNCLQGMRYIEIAEHDKTQEDFVFGWFKHRIS